MQMVLMKHASLETPIDFVQRRLEHLECWTRLHVTLVQPVAAVVRDHVHSAGVARQQIRRVQGLPLLPDSLRHRSDLDVDKRQPAARLRYTNNRDLLHAVRERAFAR